MGEQHRALALAQVVARGLAGLLGVAEDAEQVVAQLEGAAEVEAVARQRVEAGGVEPARRRADEQGVLDAVLRALVADDPPARSTRSASGRPSHGRIDSTTSRNCPAMSWVRIRSKTARPRARCLGREAARRVDLVGPGEAEVAGEHGAREAEAVAVAGPAPLGVAGRERAVRGRPPAPGVGVVHDVVVDERGGLEQLHGAREAHEGLGVGAPRGAVAPVEEGRPQPLPAAQQVGDGRRGGPRRRGPARRAPRPAARARRRGRPAPGAAGRRCRAGWARGPPGGDHAVVGCWCARAYGVAAGLPSPPWRTTEEGDDPSTSWRRSPPAWRRTGPRSASSSSRPRTTTRRPSCGWRSASSSACGRPSCRSRTARAARPRTARCASPGGSPTRPR